MDLRASEVYLDSGSRDWEVYRASRGLATQAWTRDEECRLMIFAVRTSFTNLSDKQQQLVTLRYRDGFNAKQMGERMDMTPSAADRATYRAVDSLYTKMGTV